MKRLLLILAGLAVLVLAVLLGGYLWITGSEGGARWALAQLELDDLLQFESVEGRLSDELVLKGVTLALEGQRISIDQIAVQARLRPFEPAITVESLAVSGITVRALPGTAEAPVKAEDGFELEALALPLPVDFQHVQIRDITVADETGESQFRVDQVEGSARWHEAIRDLVISASAPGLEAEAGGDIALVETEAEDDKVALQLHVDGSRFDQSLPTDLVLQMRFEGNMNKLPVSVTSAAVGLEAQGWLLDLSKQPRIELDLELARWSLDPADPDGLRLEGLVGRVRGDQNRYQAGLTGVIHLTGLPEQKFDLAGSGDGRGAELTHLQLDSELGQMNAKGAVTWIGEPSVALDLGWQGLRWPVGEETPWVTSSEGSGQLRGTPEDWRFQGNFDLQTPEYPGGRFVLTGTGGLDQAELKIDEGQALGGSLKGLASLKWAQDLKVNAQLQADALDLAVVLPDWPARLSAAGLISYQGGEANRLQLDLSDLSGVMNDEPLGGNGQITLQNDNWSFAQLQLTAGNSNLRLDGPLDGSAPLEAEVDVRHPGWVSEQLGGEVRGRIALDPDEELPLLEADLIAEGLVLGSLEIDQASLQHMPASAASPARLDLQANGLQIAGAQIDDIRSQWTLEPDRQAGNLQIRADDYQLSSSFTGAIVDWNAIVQSGWNGQVDDFLIQYKEEKLLELEGPTAFQVSETTIELDEACLLISDQGRLCGTATSADDGGSAATAKLVNLPLNILHLFFEHDVEYTQTLDGVLQWTDKPGASSTALVSIDISPGAFGTAGDEDGLVPTGAGVVELKLLPDAISTFRLMLPLVGDGTIEADLNVAGATLDGRGQLGGEISLQLEDLSFLDGFVRYLDQFSGSLDTRMAISGELLDPVLSGAYSLQNAQFAVPMLGTRVSEVNLIGDVNRADKLRLDGGFVVGSGEGVLGIDLDFSDLGAIGLMASIKGSDLRLAQLPELELEASPDLRLASTPDGWRLDGTLKIPYARLSPLTSFVDKVAESDDVVIVAGERSPVLTQERESPLVMHGEVDVSLGDDVRLEVDVAEVAMTGSTRLTWLGDVMPSANGVIRINGEVTAWGPRLTIENGTIRWTDDPATNPTLNILAERDVFGNTVVRSAGVMVAGTAGRPEVRAITRPVTTEDRAWAVLITGSDVDLGQGIGALDVGTYIAPRVFLSYGISLFDSNNVIGLRYDFRRGWGVKATSGQRESGVDLSYTIEDKVDKKTDEKADKQTGDKLDD